MIPEGWRQDAIGEHVEVTTGSRFISADYSDDPADIRILRGENIGQGRLKWKDAKRWDRKAYEGLGKFHLQAGDLVIAMDRTLVGDGLKVARVMPEDMPLLLHQRVARLRARGDIDQRLLHFLMLSQPFEQHIERVQTKTAIPHIGLEQIRQFAPLLPPLPEQRKMADILCTWDDALDTTGTLLTNAIHQHQALMQGLLSGRQRFPEFAQTPWRKTRLVDLMLGRKVKGKQVSTNEDGRGRPYIGASSLNGDFATFTDDENFVPCEPDDLLVLWDGVNAGTGATGLSGAVASTVVRFRLDMKLAQPNFLLALLEHRRKQIRTIREGSGIIHLPQDFETWFQLSLPSLAEQEKIMALLDAAKDEIRTHQAQLEQLHKERKALMQQLLTGKKRVSLP